MPPQELETVANGNIYFRILQARVQAGQILLGHLDNSIVDLDQRNVFYVRVF